MAFEGDILFLDLARVSGWCQGPLRGPLHYGSVPVAPEGSCDGALFAGMLDFIVDRLKTFRPRILAYEAPLDPRRVKATTKRTIRHLNGYPAIIEAAAYKLGLYDVREVEVADVKYYWLGRRNAPGELGKRLIRDKLRELGFDPQSLDASDAIAGHRYISADIDPTLRNEPLTLLRGA